MNKIEKIEGDNNAYAEIGSYGHNLNERLLKKEISAEEALDECVSEFENHVFENISEATKEKKYLALCSYLENIVLENTLNDVFENYEIIGVERVFKWTIGKHKMIGIIDAVFKNKVSGDVYLVDHKSASHFLKKNGEPLKNSQENFELYKKQMYLYADAMKKTLGYFPKYIVWNHFLDEGKLTIIPFDIDEYNEAIHWVKETIKQIYSDTEFTAKYDYMRCNEFCNYRNGYCEFKELLMEEEE